MDWTSGFVTAGGKALEYQCFGPAPDKAPTIVLLHEGLGCLALWRDFPQALAQATGWGVFAYSRAGYGQSDAADLPRPLDYMVHEATDVLPRLLQAIGFQRGVLMGHSDGATIATEYAGGIEDFRIRGLILMAPHFFTESMGLAEIAKAKQAYEAGDLRGKLAKYHKHVDSAFRGWNDSWLHPDFNGALVTDALDYLRIPSLVIQGRDDQYGTLAQVSEIETRSYAPVDVEILDDCRHAPQVDQPDKVLAAVAEFTQRLARIEDAVVEVA
ncbi:alpha/beta fold hydrolase [Tropicibacter oceani]|uniref:Alpha/beta hydrolase n=1 Tax=Tropicibacter oceani TaxID=3058420 RepID=A0ABY8QCN0_9RHOB|nr:alpha/beta hydrolase [Tropicibacter oceani]WGW02377.1 alpha/beta hydrolase [Tropicibacter oceani]